MKIFNAVLRVLRSALLYRRPHRARPLYFSLLNVLCVENQGALVCCIPGAPIVRLPAAQPSR
ncbi:hypothetical protein [Pseudomonas mucidolens]|uniref:Uncharacterized protein n=1 Tax=Pseudomonas mucidolens TaxID=46679 RepID=A0A1H2MEX8_9PSED|nr:hypothetical protein [Pseudomonas mucidolens]SDU91749.1 hypothetical protein SAMN05216202_1589 [Pseudomonas mucidolens]SQH33998.1 Uncharacterised protein [Pseudomonas mucidolens]